MTGNDVNTVLDELPKEHSMSTPMAGPEEGLPPLPPPTTAPPPRPPKSPGLALFLSLFPCLGQVYNGQPAKALTFFFAFACSIYGAAEISALPFGLLIPFTYFYNLVDAYRSAALINARARGGLPLPEEEVEESPLWGGVLVALGLVLLMNNLGWLRLAALERYWPALLIVAGTVFLYGSLRRRKSGPGTGPGAGDDRLD
jgi:cell wall-active antibiotic response 4TMS protein YvqF